MTPIGEQIMMTMLVGGLAVIETIALWPDRKDVLNGFDMSMQRRVEWPRSDVDERRRSA